MSIQLNQRAQTGTCAWSWSDTHRLRRTTALPLPNPCKHWSSTSHVHVKQTLKGPFGINKSRRVLRALRHAILCLYYAAAVGSQATGKENPAREIQPGLKVKCKRVPGSWPPARLSCSQVTPTGGGPTKALPDQLYHLYHAGLQWKEVHRNTQSWLERCPVLKSICYSCSGWGFSSRYLLGSSQLPVTAVRGPLPISTDTRHVCALQTYTQANTHTHQIKSFSK